MIKVFKAEIDCANCAAKIEDAIRKIDGVKSVSLSFLTQKLTIEAEEDDIKNIIKKIKKVIRRIEPDCEITEV